MQGFFLESVNAPERVISILAHGGWSVSVTSVINIVKSLMAEHQQIIRNLGDDGLCALAYGNLDFDLKTKESTLENPGNFTSITTGTFIPLGHRTIPDDLKFSECLWEKSSLNPHGPKDATLPHLPSHKYLLKQIGESLPQVKSVMLWFIKSILVNEFLPPEYKDLLSPIPSSTSIPVEKSTQYLACTMQINASSTDGNVKIVENLEC